MSAAITPDPASLQGTLTLDQLLSQAQAADAEQARQLAAQTAAASQAASQAGQQYQATAAAPMPTVDPLTELITRMGGSVASVIGRDKGYAEDAGRSLDQQHADLVKARLTNLQALKDLWDVKAQAFEKAGNLEETITSRSKADSFARQMQMLLEKQRQKAQSDLTGQEHKNRLEEISAQGEQARLTKAVESGADRAKAAAAASDYFDSLVEETPNGNRYLNLTNVPTPTDKRLAMVYAKKNGLVALDKNAADRMATIKEVYGSMDDIEAAMGKFLPKTAGMGARGALVRLESAGKNRLASALQTDGDIAAFNSTSIVGIRAIQALAAGAGSGFRLNQAEVNMMMQRWPKITDSYEKAAKNLAWERQFLKRKEESYFPNSGKKTAAQTSAATDETSAYDR